jgi:microsomal dipeptidase-like Zn-dependent dipeptidase
MAFGGNYAFAGAPGNYRNGIMEKGYTAGCGGCKALGSCDHGEFKGNLVAAAGGVGSDMGDHKNLKGPVHDSFSHLRYSTQWIREAFKPTEAQFQNARMRILVAFAVENEAMCEQLYYANKGKGGAGGDGHPCSKGDSLASLERQLDALKAWAKANRSWMEIAYSASDARRIANAGKLVVILGIESEYSFGAEDRNFDPVSRLQRYYDKGVRTFYPAHKINSRLAGADIYYPKDTDAGKAIRATQAISGCFYYDDNVGPFPLKNKLGHNFCDNACGKNYFKGNKLTDACAGKLSEISEINMADYVKLRGAGEFNGFKIYPLPPGFKGRGGSREDQTTKIERNNLGLSQDGERVVREAMLKGMIVNIDHVSSNTRKDIYEIAKKDFGGYPLNALHNNPNRMLVGNGGSLATP